MGETVSSGYSRRGFLKASAWLAGAWALPSGAAVGRANAVHLDIPFHYQRHTLSCEMAALRMAAEYLGQVHAEGDLLSIMPTDASQPRLEGNEVVWADPNRAFPGNYRGWQLYRGGLSERPDRARRRLWGYGVHAPVVATVAIAIDLQAELFDEVEQVYRAIERGWVPIVIVPDGGRTEAIRWSWHTPQGKAVQVMNAEHSVVVRGYDDQIVLVHDPKGKVFRYERPAFEKAFRLLNSGVAIGPRRRSGPRRFEPR
jgi:uncharacterized protein YvpB